MKRYLLLILGIICIGLGTLGVVTPGLPTTPFLLAASWLLYRSSPRLQRWLLESRLGGYIRDYEKRGGMRPKSKLFAVLFMLTMVACSIIFFIPNLVADVVVGVAGIVGSLVVIFKVPNAH